MADAVDSKSTGVTPMGVRLPPPAFVRLFAGILIVPMLAACLPNSVTLQLGPSSSKLRPAVVMGEERASASFALIDIRGMIADRPRQSLIGSSPSILDTVVARLRQCEKDSGVRGVLLRVNSPGGSVAGSEALYREVRAFRERTGKPVVVSMSEVAASGGYYVSLAGDEIVAEETTITASIGVIFPLVNVSEGLAKIGIYANHRTSGASKAMGDPLSPSDPAHDAIIQGLVDDMYTRFTRVVRERRPRIEASQWDRLTDGRVVTGADAFASGLVDHLGGIEKAFERLKVLAEVDDARLVVYHSQPEGGFVPRTPYAEAEPVGSPGTEVSASVVGVSLSLPSGVVTLEPGRAYYAWPAGAAW